VTSFIATPVILAASIVGLQLALLGVQFAGSARKQVASSGNDTRHAVKCAVIIPAHNEEGTIVETIRAIQSQLNSDDRLIVVADNCSDGTAGLALGTGAEIVERSDPMLRGKGFALDWGVKCAAIGTIPEVVVFIDADCVAEQGCISRLVNMAQASGRPAQGKYLMHADVPNAGTRVAEFAFKIKNYVRPAGGAQFGFPCLLYGTGMAFPWSLIQGTILANSHLAEDLKLAIDLSLTGFPPIYCGAASCTSMFPETDEALSGQRKRWEHGYFSAIMEYTPKLAMQAFTRLDWRLLVIALDLSIPPLGLMLLITVLMSGLGSALLLLGAMPIVASAMALYFPLFAIMIVSAWYFHGRQIISGADFIAIVRHTFLRVSMLWSYLVKPQRAWVRTQRKNRE
jgi:cellulose synthase/poly-beta-1,6-N-acetylglucosamine synthase-like glycosyltransferase